MDGGDAGTRHFSLASTVPIDYDGGVNGGTHCGIHRSAQGRPLEADRPKVEEGGSTAFASLWVAN